MRFQRLTYETGHVYLCEQNSLTTGTATAALELAGKADYSCSLSNGDQNNSFVKIIIAIKIASLTIEWQFLSPEPSGSSSSRNKDHHGANFRRSFNQKRIQLFSFLQRNFFPRLENFLLVTIMNHYCPIESRIFSHFN